MRSAPATEGDGSTDPTQQVNASGFYAVGTFAGMPVTLNLGLLDGPRSNYLAVFRLLRPLVPNRPKTAGKPPIHFVRVATWN